MHTIIGSIIFILAQVPDEITPGETDLEREMYHADMRVMLNVVQAIRTQLVRPEAEAEFKQEAEEALDKISQSLRTSDPIQHEYARNALKNLDAIVRAMQ